MQEIDILVVPSHDEPFGYINIEAGAAGIPVIATKVGGIPEVVIHEHTGILIDPHNSNQIADACIRLVNNAQLRESFGNNGRARVDQLFSYASVMPRWTELFNSLICNDS